MFSGEKKPCERDTFCLRVIKQLSCDSSTGLTFKCAVVSCLTDTQNWRRN